jgi:uncharacterized protein
MLKVDLGLLARKKRLQIDLSVPGDVLLPSNAAFHLNGPLDIRLEAEQSGHDVLVRGTIAGEAELACRRCLVAVTTPIDEEVALLFREGVSLPEAEDAEIYPLPDKGNELDLTGALREHLMLAVPEFAICRNSCKGLCPICGANLNETTCACETPTVDNRWAALLKKDADQV